jgi:hypothetical protein
MTASKITRRRIVPVGDLKEAAYNPPGRTRPDRLRDLCASMDLVGMLHPVTADRDNNVIDGHRRLAAAKMLGWAEVEVNVVDGDAALIYASVNVTPRRMSGNDALGVWLRCPHAVTEAQGSRFRKMDACLGRPLCRRLYAEGYSARVYDTARRIARYCDDVTDDTARAVVEWLLEFPAIGQVMKALEGGLAPAKLMKLVRAKKPLKLVLDVEVA